MTETQAWIDLLLIASCLAMLPLVWIYGKRLGAWLVDGLFNWISNHDKD